MSEMFGRRIDFEFEGERLSYPGLHIEFEIKFSSEDEGNAGHIRLFNLSSSTAEKLKKDKKFKLKAGYKNDKGIILPGIIEKHHTNWDKVDKRTILIIGDNTQNWLKTTINKTWNKGAKASQIAPKIVKQTGLQVGEIEIAEDVTYEKGKTFSTTCHKALKEIAKDTNSKLHCSRGKVYIRPKNTPNSQSVLLNSNTGLISTPEINQNGEDEGVTYNVKSLLNYRIRADALVTIESSSINGNYRVINGKHTAEGKDFTTSIEVKKVE